MKTFTIKFILFLTLFIFVTYFSTSIRYSNINPIIFLKQEWKLANHSLIAEKRMFFDMFIEWKTNINLILGSSLVEDSIIPDTLGISWFSFTSGSQSINNSFAVLKYYSSIINIDTIIIAVQPWDFSDFPDLMVNGNVNPINIKFNIFDNSQSSSSDILTYMQLLIRDIYYKIGDKYYNNVGMKDPRSISLQGFSGRIDKTPINVDENNALGRANRYYDHIIKDIEMTSFDIFRSYCDSIGCTVFYLNTPKTDYYIGDIINIGKSWASSAILDSLSMRSISLINLEDLKMPEKSFWDETHMSYSGAKIFTPILGDKIRAIKTHRILLAPNDE